MIFTREDLGRIEDEVTRITADLAAWQKEVRPVLRREEAARRRKELPLLVAKFLREYALKMKETKPGADTANGGAMRRAAKKELVLRLHRLGFVPAAIERVLLKRGFPLRERQIQRIIKASRYDATALRGRRGRPRTR